MEPKFFDVHTHLNIQFDKDWSEVGQRALGKNVWFINIGANEKSSKLALEQVEKLGIGAWASVGIHPTENNPGNFLEIRKLAEAEKVVAIGECGLEYFRQKDELNKERQKELFKQHIELSVELGKPLMIHCRPASPHVFGEIQDAYEDIWEILNFYKEQNGDRLCFNLHFFLGDWTVAQKFLALDGYLSFPGVITFSDQADEVIKKMPLDRLMSETDAPFATPIPNRGQRNEPAYIQFVAERIASLRSEDEGEVLSALVSNARRFFGV